MKLGIDKLKDLAPARHEKKLLAMEQLETSQSDDGTDGESTIQNQ